jgi:type II secretory pathway pseudopilin PulG
MGIAHRARSFRRSYPQSLLPAPHSLRPTPHLLLPTPHPPGFSLIEVIVATGLLATALVSIAQLLTVATRANAAARDVTVATVLASQKLEQLRSLVWAFGADGGPVSDRTTDLSVDPPAVDGGRGLRPSPANALSSNVAGYVEYLDRSGAWVGSGAEPPPEAVYVRRWAVDQVAGAGHTLVLTVVVFHVARAASHDARLVGMKTRKWE